MTDQPPRLDATVVARAFEVMLPAHTKVSLYHNPHGASSIDKWCELARVDFVSPVEQQKAYATGELWSLDWDDHRPATQGRMIRLAAASLPALAAWLQDNGLAFGS